MSATSQVALPDALLQEAASQASHLGVSTERWIEIAFAERIRLENATPSTFALARPAPPVAHSAKSSTAAATTHPTLATNSRRVAERSVLEHF